MRHRLTLAAVLAVTAAAVAAPPSGKKRPRQISDNRGRPAGTSLQAEFVAGGTMRLSVLDPYVALDTDYGSLKIPMRSVRRLRFGHRVSKQEGAKIAAAVRRLGSRDPAERRAASRELFRRGARAYPALKRAAKSGDAETARRAGELVSLLEASLPAERLDPPDYDVVQTEHSRIRGWVGADSLRVLTGPFGEQRLKLADLRGLQAGPGEAAAALIRAAADPGNLLRFHGQANKVLTFKVTGSASGSVWGTDVYTTDSALAKAAVHAGLVGVGKKGVVRVMVVPSPNRFAGSTRHGVSTSAYGVYPMAYRFVAGPAGQ